MDKDKYLESNNIETCVCCNRDTEYMKTDVISRRHNYVEGVGQLCVPCYLEIFGRETKSE